MKQVVEKYFAEKITYEELTEQLDSVFPKFEEHEKRVERLIGNIKKLEKKQVSAVVVEAEKDSSETVIVVPFEALNSGVETMTNEITTVAGFVAENVVNINNIDNVDVSSLGLGVITWGEYQQKTNAKIGALKQEIKNIDLNELGKNDPENKKKEAFCKALEKVTTLVDGLTQVDTIVPILSAEKNKIYDPAVKTGTTLEFKDPCQRALAKELMLKVNAKAEKGEATSVGQFRELYNDQGSVYNTELVPFLEGTEYKVRENAKTYVEVSLPVFEGYMPIVIKGQEAPLIPSFKKQHWGDKLLFGNRLVTSVIRNALVPIFKGTEGFNNTCEVTRDSGLNGITGKMKLREDKKASRNHVEIVKLDPDGPDTMYLGENGFGYVNIQEVENAFNSVLQDKNRIQCTIATYLSGDIKRATSSITDFSIVDTDFLPLFDDFKDFKKKYEKGNDNKARILVEKNGEDLKAAWTEYKVLYDLLHNGGKSLLANIERLKDLQQKGAVASDTAMDDDASTLYFTIKLIKHLTKGEKAGGEGGKKTNPDNGVDTGGGVGDTLPDEGAAAFGAGENGAVSAGVGDTLGEVAVEEVVEVAVEEVIEAAAGAAAGSAASGGGASTGGGGFMF